VLGALLKWTVNEGLARWQLVTGTTLLEGAAQHVGRWAIWLFLGYLVFWSFFVASALMNACGAAMHALVPWQGPAADRIVYGIAHSMLSLVLIHVGGFRWFERVMSGCVAVMFAVIVTAAIAIRPDWQGVGEGLLVPRIPGARDGLSWTLALIGGVGGTVTVLSYGYWIREEGRAGVEEIRTCRLDLACGYGMTALFGLGMVIVGSSFLDLAGDPNKGTAFIIDLGKQLEGRLGPFGALGRWGFVIGAWCAVASSMLGVWQSVPLLFADAWRLRQPPPGDPASAPRAAAQRTVPSALPRRPYLLFQLALATIPAVSLWTNFVRMQQLYSIVGAFFIPILAAVLLVLNRRRHLGGQRSGWLIQAVLLAALLFFLVAAIYEASERLAGG
jgi:Mn2+/Fe2+ NRAMP family transporter